MLDNFWAVNSRVKNRVKKQLYFQRVSPVFSALRQSERYPQTSQNLYRQNSHNARQTHRAQAD